MRTGIYLHVTSKGVRFGDANRSREGSERAKVELRGYPGWVDLALKGPYMKAQGNALGLETEQRINLPSPERAAEVVLQSGLLSPFQG
jgi:hypothetical protein